MAKRKKKFTDGMSKQEVEKLSKRNARKIIQGTDRLKSWGTTGWYKSHRLNKYFKFRSMIEANVIRTLDEAELYVEDFDTEQFMIPYDWKGATCNYVPDVILRTASGKIFIVEVKPASQLDEVRNRAKWAAASTWCWAKGARFFVITDEDWPHLISIIKKFDDGDVDGAQELMEWVIYDV